MQSQKKFKKPKRHTMNAQEFAIPFAQSVESYEKAVIMCDNYSMASRQRAPRTDVDKDESREALRVANFYDNVAGILRKSQVKMGAQPTPKKEIKLVKKDTPDRRPATT